MGGSWSFLDVDDCLLDAWRALADIDIERNIMHSRDPVGEKSSESQEFDCELADIKNRIHKLRTSEWFLKNKKAEDEQLSHLEDLADAASY